jgi:predicted MFS family arabinose efflux permease
MEWPASTLVVMNASIPLSHPGSGSQPAASWSGVFAMSLCAFVLVASEFMPVSLLTPVAADLAITEGQAGLAITVSGAFAVITSLCIAFVAGARDRKSLLLWMTGLMAFSGAVASLAPNYTTYMIGRALIGVAIGGFWSMSAAAAIRMVPPSDVPRALAVFNGGNALATVIAPPLGSWLGALIGWRAAFLALVPLALVALVWQYVTLRRMPGSSSSGLGTIFKPLLSAKVALGMAAVSIFFMGQFTLFTYLRPFLETVTGIDGTALSSMLLWIGIAGFIGTIVIGFAIRAHLYRTLIIIPFVMSLIATALVIWGGTTVPTVLLLGAWGLLGTAAPVGWWTWVARTLPNDAEAGGGLMVAVVQLAIGTGSAGGGVLFDWLGYQSTFFASAALLLVAAVLAFLASRAAPNRALTSVGK